MKKKNLKAVTKPPKVKKPATFKGAGTYVCSECSKRFDYLFSKAEHGKVLSRVGGSVPIRVKCPHCGAKTAVHGKGEAGTSTKREDWNETTMGRKPWEDTPRGPVQ